MNGVSAARDAWRLLPESSRRVTDSVRVLAGDAAVARALAAAARGAPRHRSAEAFLDAVPAALWNVRLAAATASATFGAGAGLRSETEDERRVEGRLAPVAFALLYNMAEQGLRPIGIEEDASAARYRIDAAIPSSALNTNEGRLRVEVADEGAVQRIALRVAFPGQLFAWGRGGRIIRRLLGAVAECASE